MIWSLFVYVIGCVHCRSVDASDYLSNFFYPQFSVLIITEEENITSAQKKANFIERHEPCYAGYMRIWLLRKSTRKKKEDRIKTNHFHMWIVGSTQRIYRRRLRFWIISLDKLKFVNRTREQKKNYMMKIMQKPNLKNDNDELKPPMHMIEEIKQCQLDSTRLD